MNVDLLDYYAAAALTGLAAVRTLTQEERAAEAFALARAALDARLAHFVELENAADKRRAK